MSIYKQFLKVPVTCISDGLKGLTNMDFSIKPLKEEYKICGPACTVQILANDNLIFLKGLQMAKPGNVLVVDAKGYEYNAIAGDFMIGVAKTLGLAGVVVDGTVRDIVEIKKLDFPVFCKGNTVAASGKGGIGEVNVPISCGGVVVYPGDIIVGDADGVVVVPQDRVAQVLELALRKEQADRERATVLRDPEATRNYLEKLLGK